MTKWSNTMTKLFAAHDDAFIYGVGNSPEAADAEYRAGIGDDQIIMSLPSITISDITPALCAKVEADGGAITWETLDDGTLCTVAEAGK